MRHPIAVGALFIAMLFSLQPVLEAQESDDMEAAESEPNGSESTEDSSRDNDGGTQDDAAGGGGQSWTPSVGISIALGVNTFEDPEDGEVETYQLIGLRPDFGIGPIGVGLDLGVNYRFTGGSDGDEFEVREDDWVPDDDTSFLELYLPKFRYIRYGTEGDPLFARFGRIPSATLGNGFIVGGYTNELYLPERPIFGAQLEVDAALLDEPYGGIETLVSNVAAWDIMAARLYLRILAGTDLPLLPDLEIGTTFAVDRTPFYFAVRDPASPYYDDGEDTLEAPDESVVVWGVDIRQPILNSPAISLAAFSDAAFQEDRSGGAIGFDGRLIGWLLYGAQIRLIQDNFVPTYFDGSYDRRREQRFLIYDEQRKRAGGFGWLARLGFSLLSDAIVFNTTLSGPMGDSQQDTELSSELTVAEGVVPGFAGLSASAGYTKFDVDDFEDLTSAEDAIIGARINMRSGPVVISLVYDVSYDPYAGGDDPWTVTSSLETTISF